MDREAIVARAMSRYEVVRHAYRTQIGIILMACEDEGGEQAVEELFLRMDEARPLSRVAITDALRLELEIMGHITVTQESPS